MYVAFEDQLRKDRDVAAMASAVVTFRDRGPEILRLGSHQGLRHTDPCTRGCRTSEA